MKKSRQSDVLRRAEKMSDAELVAFLADAPSVDADLLVTCPNRKCLQPEGKRCKNVVGLGPAPVHIGRRIKRLMLTAGDRRP